jgi:hypothetical protein
MSKVLEREIAAFVESLDAQLVRLIEEAVPHLKGLQRARADRVIELSIAELWTVRDSYDPAQGTLPAFFGVIVKKISRLGRSDAPLDFELYEDEQAVLDAFRGKRVPKPAVPEPLSVEMAPLHDPITEIEAPVRPGKECPPCYRCRYFYGWLPKKPLQPSTHSDPEIAAACDNLDRRKVEIAHQIRGDAGWSEAELQQE